MHLIFARICSFASLALTLGLGAVHAQQPQATFELPFEAHWGTSILKPGKYDIKVVRTNSDATFIYVSGKLEKPMTVVCAAEESPLATESFLRLVNVNGTYFVREYESAGMKNKFSFGVPKGHGLRLRASSSTRTVAVIEVMRGR